MNKHFFTLFLLGLVAVFSGLSAQIVVNEFMAANGSTMADPNGGEFDDWVELRNNGNVAVNIAGYFMSDDALNLMQWQVPNTDAAATTIAAGGYKLIWFDNQAIQGVLHATMKLGASGEMVVLTAPDGMTVLDSVSFGAQLSDISVGRWPNGTGSFVTMSAATPSIANVVSLPQVATIVASVSSGFYSTAQVVTLTTATLGATIRYTIDGNLPTASSALYSGALTISSTASLRAVAFKSGYLNSKPLTNTYFVGVSHTFPVVSLTSNPAYFFDPVIGIYPNYTNDTLEQPVHFEFFEGGNMAFEAEAAMNVSGTGSAEYAQKSFSIEASEMPTFDYPFFPSLPYHDYESLVLRQSGQDWNVTMFRDAMVSGLMRDFEDVSPKMRRPNLDLQGYRPGVAYLNGAYWGIYNIREHMTDTHVQTHYNIGASNLDLIENESEIKDGDLTEWNAFVNYYSNTNFSSTANYDSLKTKMDMDNWIDYNVFAIYVDNVDWPSNNNRRWREKAVGAKWRWLCYDYDFSFGLFQIGGSWNTGNATQNSLSRTLVAGNLTMWPNVDWSTKLLRKCLENAQFKADFVNRMADMINIAFDSVRVNDHIETLQATYTPEMQAHLDKWYSGWAGNWVPNINKLKSFANNRPANVRQHVVDQFAEVTGTANVTIQASPAIGGTVHFSTLTMPSANLPWTGVYFKGVSIPFVAVSNRGYVFTSWSDAALGTAAASQINLTANKTITANFAQGSVSTSPIVINEINYNSSDSIGSEDWVELYNPTSSSVNISGWYLEDESGMFFGLPANTIIPANGYLVLVEDSLAFKAVYASANTVKRGNFGDGFNAIKLGNSGETLQLFNANGIKIDSVLYDDAAPWPIGADGTGQTLQLVAPNLDNTNGANWIGQVATPGAINIVLPPQNQTIAIATIPNKITIDAPFVVAATTTSGLPMTYSIVSGPATIVGNVVSLTAVSGVVTLQATQSGNANYLAATATTTFTVSKSPQTITFPAIGGKLTTSLPFALNATASSGLTVIYNITSGPATVSGNIITLTGLPGTVKVRARQLGNPKYLAAPNVTKTFVVTQVPQANQTITFAAIPNKAITDAAFTISATASSGLPVTKTVLSGPATIVGNTVTLTGLAGTVVIQATQAGNPAYYAAPSVTQSFTVFTPQSQTINFPALSGKLTTSLPFAISATASSGLTVVFTVISGPATVSGNIVTLTGATGTVVIRANQGGNAQYLAAPFVNRSFSVTTAPVSSYCLPSSTPWYEWIINVTLNTINNTTAKTTYGNYTAQSTTLIKGMTYPISLMGQYSYYVNDEYWRVWIDYNANNVFEANEVVYEGMNVAPATNGAQTIFKTGNITIPSNATTGATRMRVQLKRGAYSGACDTIPFGEVEDYTVNIATAINLLGSTENVAQKIPFDLERAAFAPSIFPNPATNEVHIQLESYLGLPLEMTATDLTGRIFYRNQLREVTEANTEISLANWPAGVYVFRFVTDFGQPIVRKVIVMR